MHLINQIFTDEKGDFYITLFPAMANDEPVVVFYAVNNKSKVLVKKKTEFLKTFSHYCAYTVSSWESSTND